MRVGSKVRVVARWSSYFGQRGEVTRTQPTLMVRIYGETKPIAVSHREVVEEVGTPQHIAGAE